MRILPLNTSSPPALRVRREERLCLNHGDSFQVVLVSLAAYDKKNKSTRISHQSRNPSFAPSTYSDSFHKPPGMGQTAQTLRPKARQIWIQPLLCPFPAIWPQIKSLPSDVHSIKIWMVIRLMESLWDSNENMDVKHLPLYGI